MPAPPTHALGLVDRPQARLDPLPELAPWHLVAHALDPRVQLVAAAGARVATSRCSQYARVDHHPSMSAARDVERRHLDALLRTASARSPDRRL
jgi:hypothetical protein